MQQRNKSSATVAVVLYALIVFFGIYFKSITPDGYKIMIQQYYDTMNWYPTFYDRIWIGFHPFHLLTMQFQYVDILEHGFINSLAFLPFGCLVSYLYPTKKLLNATLASFLFSAFIELLQLFTIIGGFAATDVLFNTIGGFLGALLFLIFCQSNFFKRYACAFLGILIVISIPVLIILVYNTVIHIDIYLDIIFRRI